MINFWAIFLRFSLFSSMSRHWLELIVNQDSFLQRNTFDWWSGHGRLWYEHAKEVMVRLVCGLSEWTALGDIFYSFLDRFLMRDLKGHGEREMGIILRVVTKEITLGISWTMWDILWMNSYWSTLSGIWLVVVLASHRFWKEIFSFVFYYIVK